MNNPFKVQVLKSASSLFRVQIHFCWIFLFRYILSQNPKVGHFQSWQTKPFSLPQSTSNIKTIQVLNFGNFEALWAWPTSISWSIFSSNQLEVSNFPIQNISRDWQSVPTLITDRPSQIISIWYFSVRTNAACQIVDVYDGSSWSMAWNFQLKWI